jgi:hypothetical protein
LGILDYAQKSAADGDFIEFVNEFLCGINRERGDYVKIQLRR